MFDLLITEKNELIDINEKFLNFLREKNLKRPFLILNFDNKMKKVIHSIEYFLYILEKKNILRAIFKEDNIYLISLREVYIYKYSKYFKNMEII